jgi:hypothetical protein
MVQFIAWLAFLVAAEPIQMRSLLLSKPAQLRQAGTKKMQSQMQSQPPDAGLADSNFLKRMVSRAGLEPATTALKVRCSTN